MAQERPFPPVADPAGPVCPRTAAEVEPSHSDLLHDIVWDVHLIPLHRHRGRLATDVLVVLPVLPRESRGKGCEQNRPLEKGPHCVRSTFSPQTSPVMEGKGATHWISIRGGIGLSRMLPSPHKQDISARWKILSQNLDLKPLLEGSS